MFKSKAMFIFILLVFGFSFLGDFGSDTKKLDYEEIENIVVISE